MRTFYRKEIAAAAAIFHLDPLLVEAVVLTESSGNTDGFRFEPNFWNRYLKPYKQYVGQNPRRVSSSYGLMQIMYPVAIERGFPKSDAPEKLFVPDVGLYYGCKHLAFLFEWAKGFADTTEQQQLDAVLASYNGGRGNNKPTDSPKRNASYVRKVLANLDILKKEGATAA